MSRWVVLLLAFPICIMWLGCEAEQMPSITIHELHRLVASEADIFVLDVRSEGEFQAKRMLCVDLQIPFDSLQDQSHFLPTDKNAAIYCTCHSDDRSKKAFKTLTTMGYTQVLVVTGGLQAWVEAGYETTGGPE